MTEATIRSLAEQARLCAEDHAVALGRLDAILIMLRGRARDSELLVIREAIKDVTAAARRLTELRAELVYQAGLEGVYALDHAGQDAQDSAIDEIRKMQEDDERRGTSAVHPWGPLDEGMA